MCLDQAELGPCVLYLAILVYNIIVKINSLLFGIITDRHIVVKDHLESFFNTQIQCFYMSYNILFFSRRRKENRL